MYARDFPDHTNIYWPTDIAIWKLCPSLHCCLKIDPPTLRTELILKPLHQGTGMKRLLAFSVTRTYSLVGNVNWNLMESTDYFFFSYVHLGQQISALEEVRDIHSGKQRKRMRMTIEG